MRAVTATALAFLLAAAVRCTDTPPVSTPDPGPSPPPEAALDTAGGEHKLLVFLEIPHLRDERTVDVVTSAFDAFLYGHPTAEEDVVAEMKDAGLEDFRYFNVFSVDLNYPRWAGFFAELYARLERMDGFIKGARYRWFPSEHGPDFIIDHTRRDVTQAVGDVIEAWADSIDAGRVFLDVTFDRLDDWMLWEGTSWPWPVEEFGRRNTRWRANMGGLIERLGLVHYTAINGSFLYDAQFVMYENQTTNHLDGTQRWGEVVRRVMAGDVVPMLHVGHHRLSPDRYAEAEEMAMAVWLLSPRAYLAVEYEIPGLSLAGRARERGLTRFVADGPAAESPTGVWRRTGTIDGVPFEVVADTRIARGRIAELTP